MDARFLGDLTPGQRFTTGGVTFTEAAIVDFAWTWDPQPFHVDAQAAATSPFGGIIASGFHTLVACFRLFVERGIFHASFIDSPGIDALRWTAPVRPGDILHTEVEVLEVRPSSPKPDRGIAHAPPGGEPARRAGDARGPVTLAPPTASRVSVRLSHANRTGNLGMTLSSPVPFRLPPTPTPGASRRVLPSTSMDGASAHPKLGAAEGERAGLRSRKNHQPCDEGHSLDGVPPFAQSVPARRRG